MTTVTLFGNCQIKGLAECLRVMSPDLTVLACTARDIRVGACIPADVLSTSDVVLFQTPMKGKVHWEQFIKAGTTVGYFPSVYFSAFHPDVVFATQDNKVLGSPMGSMSSALALFGWVHGLTVEETIGLFSEEVYQELGYMDFWNPSASSLLAEAKGLGLDLSGEIQYWAKSGCFMHCPIHPKLIVMAGIARALHQSLGWKPEVRYPENFLVDEFYANVVWPIYPKIAERFGLGGECIFKATRKGKARRIGLSLEEFVESSAKPAMHLVKRI